MHKTDVAGVLKICLCAPKEVENLNEDIALHLNWVFQEENDFSLFYTPETKELAGLLKNGECELFVFPEMLTTLDWRFLERMYE